MKTTKDFDIAFMRTALSLAERGLGNVWPNPAVGCVLVRPDLDNRVVGRGWTQPGGRPHAETEALRRAGDMARGATAYVTLEPCDHTGQTPPCSKALIAAGIKRAVVAVTDPDGRVQGRGIRRLRENGIDVDEGCCADEATALNEGFFRKVTTGKPLFTLKSATSLDGKIAASTGKSQWITGPEARAFGHGLRARHDAIMVGIGTVLGDDPSLTCRLPGLEQHHPVRIVLDTDLKTPMDARLVQTADAIPTWIICGSNASPDRRLRLEEKKVCVIEAPVTQDGLFDPDGVAEVLGSRGLTRVLVEGGGRVAAAWLRAGLIGRMFWFRASLILGGDGIPSVAAMGVESPREGLVMKRTGHRQLGADTLDIFCKDE